jgi:hypothetical protein
MTKPKEELAFLLGVVATLYAVIMFYGYNQFLINWQTLVAGVIAAFAALATVWAIFKQIDQTKKHEDENRNRRNLAARAALSQPLSTLVGIERKIIEKLTRALTSSKAPRVKVSFTGITGFNDKDLKLLIDCIVDAELAPADDLSKLISQLQIQGARLDRKDDPVGEVYEHTAWKHNLETYLMDALLIHARAGKLLFYARREEQDYQNCSLKDAVENSFSITGSKRALRDYVTVSNDSFEERLARHILRAES